MKSIVLAGGCFWGVEAYFQRINGVINTEVGYANGNTIDPTYDVVCSGDTNHAEAVLIEYEEHILSLDELLDYFWRVIDPTSLNRQGNDRGTQYRSGIYYLSDNDIDIIKNSIDNLQNTLDKPIVTEFKPLEKFFDAEEYHQDYLKKNPNGYCHIKLD